MRGKKLIALLSVTSILAGLSAGCGPAPDTLTASDSAVAVIRDTDVSAPQDITQESSQGASASQGTTQGTSPSDPQNGFPDEESTPGGKWQVLDSKTAAVVDADFLGMVWKLDTDSFYIVEVEVEILEDGSILGGSPSTDVEIPDSELIQVVFDDNTHFYIRNIRDGGKSYEDTEAGFQDVAAYMDVDLKGRFEDDVFYAEEVRINKVL